MAPNQAVERAKTPPILQGGRAPALSAVVILQHDPDDGPCYFGTFLRSHGIPYVHIRAFVDDERKNIPSSVQSLLHVAASDVPGVYTVRRTVDPNPNNNNERQQDPTNDDIVIDEDDEQTVRMHDAENTIGNTTARIAGVASMGGCMSVNDNLQYYERVFSLFRSAISHDVPIIGHCLGAQLLSASLGGKVSRAPMTELGWTVQEAIFPFEKKRPAHIKNWFGDDVVDLHLFEWHGETFSVPEGCHLVASGPNCRNQAFQYKDKYVLGMQFHVEVDEQKIDAWIETGNDALFASAAERDAITHATNPDRFAKISPAAMTVDQLKDSGLRQVGLRQSKILADQVYGTWIEGLRQ